MVHQRWRGPLALHQFVFGSLPLALPQPGIAAGRWPFRKYFHLTIKGQRPEPIPDRGNALRDKVHSMSKGQRPEPISDRGNAPGYRIHQTSKG